MKARVSYADFLASREQADAAWVAAFEKVKALGEGAELADGWRIRWIYEDPAWFQVARKKERGMVRRGDPVIHRLLGAVVQTEASENKVGGDRTLGDVPFDSGPVPPEGLAV